MTITEDTTHRLVLVWRPWGLSLAMLVIVMIPLYAWIDDRTLHMLLSVFYFGALFLYVARLRVIVCDRGRGKVRLLTRTLWYETRQERPLDSVDRLSVTHLGQPDPVRIDGFQLGFKGGAVWTIGGTYRLPFWPRPTPLITQVNAWLWHQQGP